MIIGVNARFLLPNKLEGFGVYSNEVISRLVINNPDIEFAIRPKIGNSCWLELMKYNVTEKQLYDRKIWKKKWADNTA